MKKKKLKPNAVSTIFKRNSGLPQKKLRRDDDADLTQDDGTHLPQKFFLLKIKFKIGILIFIKPSNKWYQLFKIIAEQEKHESTSFEEPETASATKLQPRIQEVCT